MGGQAATPAPPPVFDKPWRTVDWRGKQRALEKVNKYKPYTEDQHLRILLHGPVGAGKSSFINSVQSVVRSNMNVKALADHSSGSCFTKEFTTYNVEREGGDAVHPFVFNDIMGLSANKGVLVEDVKLALKGHVKDGYKFNPESKLSEGDGFYNSAPSANDRVHILVCVIPADTLSSINDSIIKEIREIRLEASRMGIPQVAVLTKVDMACPEVGRDLKNVYLSKRIKKMMEQFSADSGIPMNCIFPVKNYHEEIDLSDDMDALILSVLNHIIVYGNDFINMKLRNSRS
ncbi:interferon-induced protein 44-like isoform X2 [Betta splendens]|nr:interferon-induced protein 44-like isoform X2 [Betta splendens]